VQQCVLSNGGAAKDWHIKDEQNFLQQQFSLNFERQLDCLVQQFTLDICDVHKAGHTKGVHLR